MTDTETTTQEAKSRETWLREAVEAFRPYFEEYGYELPDDLYVSVGFPVGRRGGSSMAIGQCHYTTRDGRPTVFISPVLEDEARVLDVLLHECIHAALPVGTGHRGKFPSLMKAWGLEGKPTATVAGDHLRYALEALARELGPYRHSKLTYKRARGRKQGTRMKKVTCDECGYIARTTRKWLEAHGAPICPCNGQVMREDF